MTAFAGARAAALAAVAVLGVAIALAVAHQKHAQKSLPAIGKRMLRWASPEWTDALSSMAVERETDGRRGNIWYPGRARMPREQKPPLVFPQE